jgi:hypothetical protein
MTISKGVEPAAAVAAAKADFFTEPKNVCIAK